MPTSLTLDTARSEAGEHVLIARGEIDLSNVEAFKRALTAAITESTDSGGALVVDLAAVDYLDSAAINVLYASADRIKHLIAPAILVSSLVISGLAELVAIESAPVTAEQ
jgi:anti-anti-sigma factor